jgi:hypothetical protein
MRKENMKMCLMWLKDASYRWLTISIITKRQLEIFSDSIFMRKNAKANTVNSFKGKPSSKSLLRKQILYSQRKRSSALEILLEKPKQML